MKESAELNEFFNHILDENEDIVDRNTFVFLELKKSITQKNFILIEEILKQFLKVSVHPSLIKSALIITSGVDNEDIKLISVDVEEHLKEILKIRK
jgi:Cys-tRNA synthase (O-phospho-L-seryl-tRNA:Cys-tRNA synthase)